MRDADIVHAIAAGERDGLSQAYRTYADRLYDYCLRLLSDPEAAADTVHDVFLIARERITQLRDPDALRSWLYAIARSQCHRALRVRNRYTPLDADVEMSDETLDPPETGVHRAEVHDLVHAAMAGLNPREYEVIHLTLRHRLDGPGLAAVLGVGVKQANAVASTARAQLKRALGALLVARTRGRDCAELRALLETWNGEFTPLWRKRINRHLSKCVRCEERRAALVAPSSLLSAIPIASAPVFLHEQLLDNAFDPDLVGHHAEVTDQAGPYRFDGFPDQSGSASAPGATSRLVLAAAVGLLVLAVFGWLLIPLTGGEEDTAKDTVVSRESTVPGQTSSPKPPPTGGAATPEATSAAATEPSPDVPAEDDQPQNQQEPGGPSLAVTGASGQDTTPPGCVNTWTLLVSAQVQGAVSAVTLSVSSASGSQQISMEPGNAPGNWYASAGGLPLDTAVTWSVTASAADGSTVSSGARTASRPNCTGEDEEADSGEEEPVLQ